MTKALIIGNGVSLNKHLELGHFDMINVPTWACNQIDRLYHRTDWRPDNYVCMEFNGHVRQIIRNKQEFLDRLYKYHIEPDVEKCYISTKFGGNEDDNDPWGTIGKMFELAYDSGATDVGLIGCDLGITEPTIQTVNLVDKVIDTNHFDPDYWTYQDKFGWEDVDSALEEEHKIWAHLYKKDGRTITNVGIGGALGIHPRKEFEEWLLE